jgi:hypothetical protein
VGAAAGKTLTKTGNCFVAGTEIQTIEGEKNIEDIQVGDWVLADDPNTPGEVEYKQVLDTFIRHTDKLVDLFVDGEVISTTGEHPLWTPDKGWVEAKDLVAGSLVMTEDGRVIDIDGVETRNGDFIVYNFKVDGFHSYFVSDLGILVHNADYFYPPGVGGNGASSHLPDMRDFKPDTVQEILSNAGFNAKNITTGSGGGKGGWQEFVHPDGSRVDIYWPTGRIVRTPAPIYGPNGTRINKGQRLDYNGEEIPRSIPHDQHPPEFLGT